MPTSFTVFSLGQLPIWDTVEGNTTLATGNVNAALGTYGSAGDPLFNDRADFAPAGTGFAGGDPDAYDIDNNTSNDQFSIDGGATQSFDAAMVFDAEITYLDGTTATITAVVFQDTVGNTYWAPEFTGNADQDAILLQAIQSIELITPVYVPGTANSGYNLFADRVDAKPLCFAAGTRIRCPGGDRAIEDLAVGDLVMTRDHGPQPIRWIGSRVIGMDELRAAPKQRPVQIAAGALGQGLPLRDLTVSRQHRVLVRSKIAERMFGKMEVLVPAVKLVEIPGIYVDEVCTTVTYLHLLFDQHQIIYAEDAPTESLFTGPEALKSVSPAARAEILTLFPEVANLDYAPEPARFMPSGKSQKNLIARHVKNKRAIVHDA
ncbi:MAG: Hint domain-containing protein [Pseudomonadota bacterium]